MRSAERCSRRPERSSRRPKGARRAGAQASGTNPATIVGPIVVGTTVFKLPGQTPGAIVYVRVLTIDPKLPTGQSEYTPWVAVMVGA